MVEHWSSKPIVEVRFFLLLIFFFKKFTYFFNLKYINKFYNFIYNFKYLYYLIKFNMLSFNINLLNSILLWIFKVWRYLIFNNYFVNFINTKFNIKILLKSLNFYNVLLNTVFFKKPRVLFYKYYIDNIFTDKIYINYIILKLMSFLINKKIYLIIIKNLFLFFSISDFYLYNANTFNTQIERFKFIHYFNPAELYNLLFLSFKFLNIDWLYIYFQRILKKMIIFKHKIFFSYLFSTLLNKFFYLFNNFKIKGLFLSIKGKIGVSGNSRKRRIFLNLGNTSRYDTNVSVLSLHNILNTTTGVLGLKLYLFHFK